MQPLYECWLNVNRRQLLKTAAGGLCFLGATALQQLLAADQSGAGDARSGGLPGLPHFAPKAKRVIYLYMEAHHRSSIPSITSRSWLPSLAKTCRRACAARNG